MHTRSQRLQLTALPPELLSEVLDLCSMASCQLAARRSCKALRDAAEPAYSKLRRSIERFPRLRGILFHAPRPGCGRLDYDAVYATQLAAEEGPCPKLAARPEPPLDAPEAAAAPKLDDLVLSAEYLYDGKLQAYWSGHIARAITCLRKKAHPATPAAERAADLNKALPPKFGGAYMWRDRPAFIVPPGGLSNPP